MYHAPIYRSAATPLEIDAHIAQPQPGAGARIASVLIVCGLPLIGIFLLLRFVLLDLLAVARGVRLFHRAVTEELGRGASK